jgi:predicted HAD superfamily Cof-like phosphohydrolase
MPHLMNCPHSDTGWCLACVAEMYEARGTLDKVREFHHALGVPVGDRPKIDQSRVRLRLDLIAEEFRELCEALNFEPAFFINPLHPPWCPQAVDIVAAADALAGLRYVVEGAALEWGIPLDKVTAEVHAANMRKVGGAKRPDGKILKPEGWVPPDVAGVLAEATARAELIDQGIDPDREWVLLQERLRAQGVAP